MTDSGDKGRNIIEAESGELSPLGIIKTEANLSWLPFFALSRQDVKQRVQTEYRVSTERDGKKLEVSWNVTANAKHGYPGPFDRRVHKTIEYIINEKGIPIENPIPFSLYQIMKILRVDPSGRMRQRIKQSLVRIFSASVTSEGIFYSKPKKRYISDNFHIYDRVVFKEQTLPNGETADTNYLFLSQWYLDSINAFYIRPIDFDYLQQLRSDIAGRLYELLSLKFYGVILNRKPYWRVEYRELCDLLPITPQRYPSLAQQSLAPAHGELIETLFLSKVMWDATDNRHWYVLYYPGKKAREELRSKAIQEELPLALPDSASAPQLEDLYKSRRPLHRQGKRSTTLPTLPPEKTLTPEEQELFSLLKDRRMGQKTAVEMVKTHPKRIREKVEILDWMIQHCQEKIQSPTGFLRRMIEEDWPPPEGFISQADREEQARHAEARQQERQRQEDARRAAEAQVEQAREQRKATNPWKTLWEQIADELARRMPRQSFSIWIQPLFIAELQDNAVVLDCPSQFIQERLEESYRPVIEEAVTTVCGEEKHVIFAYVEG